MLNGNYLRPVWPAPENVRALSTTRQGGVSEGVYHSLNVGAHVGDVPEHVAENRARVQAAVSVPVAYLNQTHSPDVVQAAESVLHTPDADASVDTSGNYTYHSSLTNVQIAALGANATDKFTVTASNGIAAVVVTRRRRPRRGSRCPSRAGEGRSCR